MKDAHTMMSASAGRSRRTSLFHRRRTSLFHRQRRAYKGVPGGAGADGRELRTSKHARERRRAGRTATWEEAAKPIIRANSLAGTQRRCVA